MNRKNGFTIIELVVAMGVFLSLFLIVIVNFRSGESINELRLETQKIASDIRKVQTLALTGSNYNSASVGSGGYGIRFTAGSSNEYFLFADLDADGMYDGETERIETRDLAGDISNLSFNPTKDNIDIVFKPYSSEISIKANNGVDVISGEVELLILHSRATGKTGVVTAVPVSGKIDFELQES